MNGDNDVISKVSIGFLRPPRRKENSQENVNATLTPSSKETASQIRT